MILGSGPISRRIASGRRKARRTSKWISARPHSCRSQKNPRKADRYPDLLRGLKGLPRVPLVTFFGLADQPPTIALSTAATYSWASVWVH